jgi:hypothetical protein
LDVRVSRGRYWREADINIVRRADATAACDRLRNPEQLGRPHFALPAPDGVECVETLIVGWLEVRELVSCTSGRSSRRLTAGRAAILADIDGRRLGDVK